MISNYDLSDFDWTPEPCPECLQPDGSGELLGVTANSLHIWVYCRHCDYQWVEVVMADIEITTRKQEDIDK